MLYMVLYQYLSIPGIVVGNPVNRLFDSHIVNGFIHASPLQSKANCVEDPRNEFTIVPSDTNYVCMVSLCLMLIVLSCIHI